MDITQLIPKDKHDIETAERLFQYNYEEIKPIVPQLLEWLQDANWPVCEPVSKYLETILPFITAEIIKVLRSNDSIWKYWCIKGLLEDRADLNPLIIEELKLLAATINKQDIEEEVHILSQQLLKSLSL